MAAQSTPAHPAIMKAEVETTNTTANSPIPTPFVTTQRLIIRNMHPSDAPSMCLNADNPRIAKHMSLLFPDPYTLAEANKWINMNINIPQVDNWVLCERDAPDTVIGGIGLKLGRDVSSHTAEVGFWIGEKFWGRGYMPEVLEAFTEWCFLERITEGKRLMKLGAFVFSPNTGSMRCLEKCGYAKEGVMRGHVEKRGEVMDLHVFGITKGDWEERKKDGHTGQTTV